MHALIVDDSNFIREYLRQQLQRMGIASSQVGDGLEALQVLGGGEAFDLILVDVNMPNMGGLECARVRQQRGLCPSAKLMMVTTEADHSFIQQALAFGADEFLMKPFTLQSLREKLLILGFDSVAVC